MTCPSARLLSWLVGCSACILGCGATDEASEIEGPDYRVGPGETYEDLRDVASRLRPGDVVEVAGGYVYPGGVYFGRSGTAEAPIVVRGVRSASGARPVLAGGDNTVHLAADHFLLEGFEITGGSFRCVFAQGDDVTLRDVWVRDCSGHGILAADVGSGSLALEYVEVSGSGEGDTRHPVYVATDEERHPGARFRMEHCFLHDNRGGNGVKSRAERNEIRTNWIEGSPYFELDLVGPEEVDSDLRREDSDVVGNVLRKTTDGGLVRIGGDGTGETAGRYRFANNTLLGVPASSSAAIRLEGAVDALEIHDNVFYEVDVVDGWRVIADDSVEWASGVVGHSGSNNWVPTVALAPAEWHATLRDVDPSFVDFDALDLRPAPGSSLVDKGAATSTPPPGLEFPDALVPPVVVPARAIQRPARARPHAGPLDVGAFELE